MSMIIHKQSEPFIGWESALRHAGKEAGICQSTFWAEIKRCVGAGTPLFTKVTEGNSDRCYALFISASQSSKLPFLKELQCLHGPVLLSSEKPVQSLRAIVKGIYRGWFDRFFTSVSFMGFAPLSAYKSAPEITSLMSEEGFNVSKWATIQVDLLEEEDKLFSNLKKSCREKIRKSEKQNINVRECEGYEDFLNNFFPVYIAAGQKVLEPAVVEASFQFDTEGRYHYILAETAQGEKLAVVGLYMFNDVAVRMASAITQASRDLKIPAQDLLTWKSIMLAKKLGAATYDLAGVNPQPQSQKEKNIRSFKEKWGGSYVEYNQYEKRSYVFDFLRRAYQTVSLFRMQK